MVRAWHRWRRSGILLIRLGFVAFEHNEGRGTEHLFLRLVFYATCHYRVGIQQILGFFPTQVNSDSQKAPFSRFLLSHAFSLGATCFFLEF
jgi:hypothetical protein